MLQYSYTCSRYRTELSSVSTWKELPGNKDSVENSVRLDSTCFQEFETVVALIVIDVVRDLVRLACRIVSSLIHKMHTVTIVRRFACINKESMAPSP